MIIEVHVITNAKKRELSLEGHYLKVKITALPKEGKANAALIGFLADFFGVRKSEVKITKGEKEKRKLISLPINEEEFKQAIGKEMAD
ncbi:MAG: hypothetical protein H6Q54_119 [Deltaproteobacteria bacterium]|jgi:hypothetical protein|nr:hypothetical protein [Deltaproteobacteria bacterium]